MGEGETARLAKEAIERAREEARRLGLPTKGLLLGTDQGSAFRSEAFRSHLYARRIGEVFALRRWQDRAVAPELERREAHAGGDPRPTRAAASVG